MEEKKNEQNIEKYMILDTAFFIKLTPLNLMNGTKYLMTKYIANEIRDINAREYYGRNKEFITIKNPSKESMKEVSTFAKISNDLSCLSIADLSVIALAYETIKDIGKVSLLRKEPNQYQVVEKVKKKIEKENAPTPQEDNEEDEGEWITPENINEKINSQLKITSIDIDTKNPKAIPVFVNTADYTVQNVCLKMGIPVLGVDGKQIKKIKNYIFKCTTCFNFVFDTTKKFCDNCGYPTLMKIGYSVYQDGNIKINDKKADPRKRGCQFDLPKPSLDKKAAVYILAEDQMPKQKNQNVNIDKILENYENMKEIPKIENKPYENNSSKKYVWGYPRQNPNKAKRKYNKK